MDYCKGQMAKNNGWEKKKITGVWKIQGFIIEWFKNEWGEISMWISGLGKEDLHSNEWAPSNMLGPWREQNIEEANMSICCAEEENGG